MRILLFIVGVRYCFIVDHLFYGFAQPLIFLYSGFLLFIKQSAVNVFS